MAGEYLPEIVQTLKKPRKCGLVTGLLLHSPPGHEHHDSIWNRVSKYAAVNAPISNQWDV